jgi:phosphoglycerate dehydrogenase-like enzyme
MVEVNEGVLWPDTLTKFLARYQYSRLFEESGQDLERLTLAADAHTVLAKKARLKVELEDRKTNDGVVWIGSAHGGLDVFDVTAQGTF